MRKLFIAAVFTALVLLPAASQAGWLVEGSLGKGYQVSKERAWEQSNFMVAPGWSPPVLSLLRLQLGVAVNFADKDNSKTNYELRPMVSICPPILPIFGRAILAVQNMRALGGKREYAVGAAGGVRFGLGPIGVFGEIGALPHSRKVLNAAGTGTESKFLWVIEARAGAYLEF
jgi:hypothetical protein